MSEAYKAQQGLLVRRAAFWSLFILVVWGLGIEFYSFLTGFSFLQKPLFSDDSFADAWQLPLLGQVVNWAFVIAWALVGFGGMLLHRWLNRPKTAEFLIATDDELGKVSWPSRKDAWNSSVIVMIFVVFLAGFLLGVDQVLENLFRWILTPKGMS